MGKDKGLLTIKGKPMIEHQVSTLETITTDIMIISNQDGYDRFGYPVYPDLIKNKGPLAGIYTGLRKSTKQVNIILACDTPFITASFLRFMLERYDDNALIPVFQEQIHPLAGIYPRSVAPALKKMLEKGMLSLTETVNRLHADFIEINEDKGFRGEALFANINDPETLKRFDRQ